MQGRNARNPLVQQGRDTQAKLWIEIVQFHVSKLGASNRLFFWIKKKKLKAMVLMPRFCLRTPLSFSSIGHQRSSFKVFNDWPFAKMPWQAVIKIRMALFPLKWLVWVYNCADAWSHLEPNPSKLYVLLCVCQHCGFFFIYQQSDLSLSKELSILVNVFLIRKAVNLADGLWYQHSFMSLASEVNVWKGKNRNIYIQSRIFWWHYSNPHWLSLLCLQHGK